MSNLEIEFKEFKQIRNTVIKGLAFEYLPAIFIGVGASEYLFEIMPSIEVPLMLLSSLSLLYGYILCLKASIQYARYKGYPGYFGLIGILNIVGLSFLFLLDNKNKIDIAPSDNNHFENFSLLYILIGYIAIPTLLFPIIIFVTAAFKNIGIEEASNLLEDPVYCVISSIPIEIVFTWYLFKEIKKANLNLHNIIGFIKKINFKLPVTVAIAHYFFAWGFNSITLYYLSFVIPSYVDKEINRAYITTSVGWIFYGIVILIFAPIIEETLCRGIIFQKLAVEKNIVKALIISAIIFTIPHFRYDIVPLFTMGVICAILYLKTKQLTAPIISHFFYNLMVYIGLLHDRFFSKIHRSIPMTIAEYQQQFIDNFELKILFVALSAPYLIYFNKNFPRNYDFEN